eukprot:scaffold10859_cov14-Tisochrysis_lutea.AAC.1
MTHPVFSCSWRGSNKVDAQVTHAIARNAKVRFRQCWSDLCNSDSCGAAVHDRLQRHCTHPHLPIGTWGTVWCPKS